MLQPECLIHIHKYRILLNESVNPLKQYFSFYDIKNIIKANIDYHLSNEFYITDMEKVMEYGVMSMPAIVVNEKVVSMGKVLKAADVEKLLHKLGY